MPRFRFVAADSTGQVSDGAIDAATQTDARHKLAANGLAVRELEEVAAGAAAAAPEFPRRGAAARSAEPVEPLPMRRSAKTEPADVPRRGSPAALLLSIAALVIALASGAYVVYRDPPWGKLSRYDFSTPERAYTSHLRIEANADIHAMMELQRKLDGNQVREKLDSVRIADTVNHNGKAVLFVEYTIKGSQRREVAYFEEDRDHARMWKPTIISDQEIQNTNVPLYRKITEWRSSGLGHMLAPGD